MAIDRFLRLPAVKEITGRGTTAIYEDMKAGNFPKSIALSKNCVAWVESEVKAWMDERIAKSRAA